MLYRDNAAWNRVERNSDPLSISTCVGNPYVQVNSSRSSIATSAERFGSTYTTAVGRQGTIRDRWGNGTQKPQREYNYSDNSTSSYADAIQMQILKLIIVLRSQSY